MLRRGPFFSPDSNNTFAVFIAGQVQNFILKPTIALWLSNFIFVELIELMLEIGLVGVKVAIAQIQGKHPVEG